MYNATLNFCKHKDRSNRYCKAYQVNNARYQNIYTTLVCKSVKTLNQK